MTDTFTWHISNLDRRLADGFIERSYWNLTAKRGEFVTGLGGNVVFTEPDPAKFVPYSQVTEDLAIQWTRQSIGDEQLDLLNERLEHELDLLENPVEGNGVPWSETEPEEAESEEAESEPEEEAESEDG